MSLEERSAPASAAVLPASEPAARGWRLSKRAGFCLVAFLVLTGLLGSYTLSPLYAVYQDRWHFSDLMLSVAFACIPLARWRHCWPSARFRTATAAARPSSPRWSAWQPRC
jgi:hypothetical protein